MTGSSDETIPSSNVLPFPVRDPVPPIGAPVICRRDLKPGFVERIIWRDDGAPVLAVVRVRGGFGARLLPFHMFSMATRQARHDA